MRQRRWRWAAGVLKAAVLVLVLGFVVKSVVELWPQIRGQDWQLSPPHLVAAAVVGLACQGMLIAGWWLSLRLVGADISWRGAAESQALGQLAKYVPGKVLTLVGKVYLATRAGAPESRAVLAMFVEAAVQTATALVVGCAYILASGAANWQLLALAAGLAAAGIAVLHPALLPRMVNAALRFLGRTAVPLQYRFDAVLPLAGCYLLQWLLIGLGLWLLSYGLGLALPFVGLTAGYAMAWAAGFLSFIFPGGLGVREYALAQLMGPEAGPGAAMGVALASRAWLLACELATALAVWLYECVARTRSAEERDPA